MARAPPAARKPDRPYHHGDLRRALLDEALATIRADGIDGLTLRERRPGRRLAHGALPPLRRQVGLALSGRHRRIPHAPAGAPRRVGRGRPWARGFESMGVAYVRFAVAHPAHYRVMFGGFVVPRRATPNWHRGGGRVSGAGRCAGRVAARAIVRTTTGAAGEIRLGGRARHRDARHRWPTPRAGRRGRADAIRARAAAHGDCAAELKTTMPRRG